MRRTAGWFGIAVTIVLSVIFIVFRVAAPWRLFLFLPAVLSATGFLQARMSFCVNFGMRGVENFGDKVGKVITVADPISRRLDRRRSIRIMGYSAGIALVVALAGFLSGAFA